MSTHTSNNWLNDIFQQAEQSRWCTRPFCTTCGCQEFRLAYWCMAARRAGVVVRQPVRRAGDVVRGFSQTESDAVVRSLVAGLRGLSPQWCDSTGFRTVLVDLDPPLLMHGVALDLARELAFTPAGAALTRMRAHEKERRQERARREAYESPEAVEHRMRDEAERRAQRHADRQAAAAERGAERLRLLEQLAAMSPQQRLARFATDDGLNLDFIPQDLVPTRQADVAALDPQVAQALVARIGGRPRAWGQLRREIESRFGVAGS
jgi:hypothetical protein